MTFDWEEFKKEIFAWDEAHSDRDVITRDSMILEKIFNERPITPCPEERFFYDEAGGMLTRQLENKRLSDRYPEVKRHFDETLSEGALRRGYSGHLDTGHTAPDYENVFRLGLPGLLKRLETYAEHAQNEEQRRYYEAGIRTWRAAISFIRRAADEAGNEEQASALRALSQRPPQTLYEAIQLTFLYYMLQHRFDGSAVRTLGRLDHLYEPFRAADMASGRLDDAGVRQMIGQMMRQIDGWKITSNLPFAVGGTGADGRSAANETSAILIETYARLAPPNVKLHFLYTEDMPAELVRSALNAVRKGANSICFFGDRTVTESLLRRGEDADDARNYAVVGCYECGGRGELTCSCNARVNIPKAIEAVFGNGRDLMSGAMIGLERTSVPETYEAFLEAFFEQLEHFCHAAMRITDAYEEQYRYVHSAPIFSATYDACVESGRDIYCQSGAKYTNSSLNALGIATAADSLYAVKKLVYEDRVLTLSELGDVLKRDWEGHETLRLRVRNRFPKYGMGVPEIDRIAARIVEKLSAVVNGHPNVKGGSYRLGMFSIDWRHEFGKKTAATPDGRRNGETLSQNSSASFGADREGVTAHILSVTEQDHTLTPNGSVMDLDLHSSAVQGEEGLAAMEATLRTFVQNGGFAVHYNVLDTSVLRRAAERPEDYPNLQVRLCGWNVLFSSLTPYEQQEFIARAESRVQ